MILLWGLIFTKCFLVEYAVQTYGAPVNSVIYVWTLSLTMAAVVTLINFRNAPGDPLKTPLTSRLGKRLWVGAFIAMLLVGVASITFGLFSAFTLPGLFASILGFAYFVQSMLSQRRLLQVAAVGWWTVAIPLFALSDARSLLGFGLSIFCLQVIPTALIWWRAKQTSQSAV